MTEQQYGFIRAVMRLDGGRWGPSNVAFASSQVFIVSGFNYRTFT